MVIEFDTLDEMWMDTIVRIKDNGVDVGSRDGACREILGFSARLKNPHANFIFNPVRRMHPSYAAAELLWYLSGSRKVDFMLHYASQYERFADIDPDSTLAANGAYGFRLRNGCGVDDVKLHMIDQLKEVISLLKEKQETRQAVLTMYLPWDLERAEGRKGTKDIPCTQSLNLIIRDGKLNMIATMRSNDVWLGMPYDVFCFSTLQSMLAYDIGVEVGWYQHNVCSMHLYDRNRKKAEEAISGIQFMTGSMNYTSSLHGDLIVGKELWRDAIRVEGIFRSRECEGFNVTPHMFSQSIYSHLIYMIAVKWCPPQTRKDLLHQWNCRQPLMASFIQESF